MLATLFPTDRLDHRQHPHERRRELRFHVVAQGDACCTADLNDPVVEAQQYERQDPCILRRRQDTHGSFANIPAGMGRSDCGGCPRSRGVSEAPMIELVPARRPHQCRADALIEDRQLAMRNGLDCIEQSNRRAARRLLDARQRQLHELASAV